MFNFVSSATRRYALIELHATFKSFDIFFRNQKKKSHITSSSTQILICTYESIDHLFFLTQILWLRNTIHHTINLSHQVNNNKMKLKNIFEHIYLNLTEKTVFRTMRNLFLNTITQPMTPEKIKTPLKKMKRKRKRKGEVLIFFLFTAITNR